MRRWRPAPSGGSLVGILALLLCASALAGILYRAIPDARGNTPASVIFWGLAALLIAAIVALGMLVWGYLTLSYTLVEQGDGALVLRWAWRRITIPLDEIEYLGAARQLLTEGASPRLWPWPGYYLSSVRDEALGRIALFATLPPRRQLLVCSARGSFGFSPDRPADFLAQFHELYEARLRDSQDGAAPLPSTRLAPAAADLEDEEDQAPPQVAADQRAFREQTAARPVALFADPAAVTLMLLGGALLAAMLWFILLRFDSVPQTLPLHYNTLGQPDRIGSPREIFLLPLIAGVVAAANIALAWSVIRFDRFAAHLLLTGTCLVQAVTWVALLKLF